MARSACAARRSIRVRRGSTPGRAARLVSRVARGRPRSTRPLASRSPGTPSGASFRLIDPASRRGRSVGCSRLAGCSRSSTPLVGCCSADARRPRAQGAALRDPSYGLVGSNGPTTTAGDFTRPAGSDRSSEPRSQSAGWVLGGEECETRLVGRRQVRAPQWRVPLKPPSTTRPVPSTKREASDAR